MNVIKQDNGTFVFDDGNGRTITMVPDYIREGIIYVYEVLLDLGSGKGDADGFAFGREVTSWMFNETDCVQIYGVVANTNTGSLAYANIGQWDVEKVLKNKKTREEHSIISITIGKWIHRRGKVGLEKALSKKPKKRITG